MRYLSVRTLIVLIVVFLALSTDAHAVTGVVETVLDGDTYDIRVGSDLLRVRCLLIDTPELHHPVRGEEELGLEAMKFARSVLMNRTVRLEFESRLHDRYGRTLAHVWYPVEKGTSLIAADLCSRGLALPLFMEDGVQHAEMVERSTETAASTSSGLWHLAEGRRFSSSQAGYELTLLRGNFITMNMAVRKVIHRGSSWTVYPARRGICLSVRDRIWREIPSDLFEPGKRVTLVGKVQSGYRGPVMEILSPAQLR